MPDNSQKPNNGNNGNNTVVKPAGNPDQQRGQTPSYAQPKPQPPAQPLPKPKNNNS